MPARSSALAELRKRLGKVWLALPGGGYTGVVQAGMCRTLSRCHISPCGIGGVSVGAVQGYGLAEGSFDVGIGRVSETWEGVAQRGPGAVFPISTRDAFREATRGREPLLDGSTLYRLVRRCDPVKVVASQAEFRVGTWDESANRYAVFSNWRQPVKGAPGLLERVAVASASIKRVFPSVEIDGSRYSDPGYFDFSSLVGACDTLIIALSYPWVSEYTPPNPLVGVLSPRYFGLALRNRVALARFSKKHPGVRVVRVYPSYRGVRGISTNWFPPGALERAREDGERAMEKALRRLLSATTASAI